MQHQISTETVYVTHQLHDRHAVSAGGRQSVILCPRQRLKTANRTQQFNRWIPQNHWTLSRLGFRRGPDFSEVLFEPKAAIFLNKNKARLQEVTEPEEEGFHERSMGCQIDDSHAKNNRWFVVCLIIIMINLHIKVHLNKLECPGKVHLFQ